ncbi:hypothetical protein [Sphingomonas sanguinis]
MNQEVLMARTIEQERAALAEDERRLTDRRRQLEERERDEAIKALDRAGLLKLDPRRIESLGKRIKALGVDEVEKRLAA